MAEINVQAGGPPPVISIFVGQAMFGRYRVFTELLDDSDKQLVMVGNNADNVPDIFPVTTVTASLQGRKIHWDVAILAFDADGHQYFVRVQIAQNGQLLFDQAYQDNFTQVATVSDEVEVVLV